FYQDLVTGLSSRLDRTRAFQSKSRVPQVCQHERNPFAAANGDRRISAERRLRPPPPPDQAILRGADGFGVGGSLSLLPDGNQSDATWRRHVPLGGTSATRQRARSI